MKDSAKYVGTPQSVAIRIPDCSVTTHLIDLVSGSSTLLPAAPATGPCCSWRRGGVCRQLVPDFIAEKRVKGITPGSERQERRN